MAPPPAGRPEGPCIILANEYLDALPARMMCGYCAAAKRLLDQQGRRLYRARCQLLAGAAAGDDLSAPMAAPLSRRSSSATIMSAAPTTCTQLERQGKLDGLLAGGMPS